jgi:cobalt-zinc-cadmium efflux system protein
MPSDHAAPTSDHLHAHLDGDASHGHFIEARSQKALGIALAMTLLFAVIEVVTGFMSNSLALISDAGHMVTDAAALGARPPRAIPSASCAPKRSRLS